MRKFALMAMLVAATAMRVGAVTCLVEAEAFAEEGWMGCRSAVRGADGLALDAAAFFKIEVSLPIDRR